MIIFRWFKLRKLPRWFTWRYDISWFQPTGEARWCHWATWNRNRHQPAGPDGRTDLLVALFESFPFCPLLVNNFHEFALTFWVSLQGSFRLSLTALMAPRTLLEIQAADFFAAVETTKVSMGSSFFSTDIKLEFVAKLTNWLGVSDQAWWELDAL